MVLQSVHMCFASLPAVISILYTVHSSSYGESSGQFVHLSQKVGMLGIVFVSYFHEFSQFIQKCLFIFALIIIQTFTC